MTGVRAGEEARKMIEADLHKQVPEDGLMWLGPAQEAQKDAKNLGQGKCQVHRHFHLFSF